MCRIQRDVAVRGRDVAGVIEQYTVFVKPSFDTFVAPSRKHADVIIPWIKCAFLSDHACITAAGWHGLHAACGFAAETASMLMAFTCCRMFCRSICLHCPCLATEASARPPPSTIQQRLELGCMTERCSYSRQE